MKLHKKLREPTSWAGLLSIVGVFLTHGVSALADPAVLTTIASGVGLILAAEP